MTLATHITTRFFVVGIACIACVAAAQAEESKDDEQKYEISMETFQTEDFQDDLASIEGASIRLSETIQFHFALTQINEASWPVLNRVADLLKAHPEIVHIQIEGHTDYVGTRARNQELSEERALIVQEYLVDHGIHPDRLSTQGFGETKPKVKQWKHRKRKRIQRINRRVEFILTTSSGEPVLPQQERQPGVAEVIALSGENALWVSAEDARPLEQRAVLLTGAALESQEESWFMLRFQDLGRVRVEAATRVKIVRLEWSSEEERRTMALKLVRGAVELDDRADSEAVLLSAEGTVTLVGAHARVEREGGATTVLLYRGHGHAETSTEKLDLQAGQIYRLTQEDGVEHVGSLPTPPSVVSPAWGEISAEEPLVWGVSDAERGGAGEETEQVYMVELAQDPQFVHVFYREQIAGQKMPMPSKVEQGQEIYVRVRALDEHGYLGSASPVFQLTRR